MKSPYYINGDVVHVILVDGKVAIFDLEDLERIDEGYVSSLYTIRTDKWGSTYAVGGTYVDSRGYSCIWRIPKFLMGIKNGERGRPTYLNNNYLDFRKRNIVIKYDVRGYIRGKSSAEATNQYKGVSLCPRTKRWRADIIFNGILIFLGRYKDDVEAARAYDVKCKELFGEFAFLNFPDEWDLKKSTEWNINNNEKLLAIKKHQEDRIAQANKKTSKYRGVVWCNRSKKWVASIYHKSKRIYIKVFIDEDEAGRAYDEKAKELHGEHAVLNFPDNKDKE